MTKIRAVVNDTEETLDIRVDGDRVFATVADRHYEIVAREYAENSYLLEIDGRRFDCLIFDSRKDRFQVLVNNHSFRVTVYDPKRLGSFQTSGGAAGKSVQIIAPMPGKVVRVLVEQGATVDAGDGIIVVEAMKMQNEMKSPKAGVVRLLSAKLGSNVNGGDILAVID